VADKSVAFVIQGGGISQEDLKDAILKCSVENSLC